MSPINSSLVSDESQVEKFHWSHDGPNLLQRQLKIFEDCLPTPKNEIISSLFNAIRLILKRSTNICDNSTEQCEQNVCDVNQGQKFYSELKNIINVFQVIQESGCDTTLKVILATLNFIIETSRGTTTSDTLRESSIKKQKLLLEDSLNQEWNVFQVKEHPLQNDVVLRTFFKFFDVEEFPQLRLVCQKWNRIIISLLKRSENEIRFIYSVEKNTYYKPSSPSATLGQFNQCLSQSLSFPVVNFEFSEGNLACPDSQQFFTHFGKHIKTLTLSLSNNNSNNDSLETVEESQPIKTSITTPITSIQTFRNILLNYGQNIEQIVLSSLPDEWNKLPGIELFPEPRGTIQLPKLTAIITEKTNFIGETLCKIIQDIIHASCHLKYFYGYKIEYFDPSASDNRVYTVQDFEFAPTVENLDVCLQFAQQQPKLQRITISGLDVLTAHNNNPRMRGRIVEILETILKSSQSTLEEVWNFPPLAYLPGIKIPPMDYVYNAHFIDWDSSEDLLEWITHPNQSSSSFPRPLNLGHIFPNLHEVSMEFDSPACSEHYKNYFDYSKPVLSVEYLSVNNETCPEFVEKLIRLFPAVVDLFIFTTSDDFPTTMKNIWAGLPNINVLTVRIYKYQGDQIITSLMDSGITGMSSQDCEILKKNSRNVKIQDAAALKETSSISDAKYLSSFAMEFQFEDDSEVLLQPIFSIVSAIYGWEASREKNQLKVMISVCDDEDNNIDRGMDVGLQQVVNYLDN